MVEMGRRLVAACPTPDKFEECHAESVVAESVWPGAADIRRSESIRSDTADIRRAEFFRRNATSIRGAESVRRDRAWRFLPPTATRPIQQLRATRPRSIRAHRRCGAICTLRGDARRRRGTALVTPGARARRRLDRQPFKLRLELFQRGEALGQALALLGDD